jgi:hypothetical protein
MGTMESMNRISFSRASILLLILGENQTAKNQTARKPGQVKIRLHADRPGFVHLRVSLSFRPLNFDYLVFPVASLPLPAIAALGGPLFHLFRDVLLGLAFGPIKNVAVIARNRAADAGIDTLSEWLDTA